MVEHVKRSCERAAALQSGIDPRALDVPGLTCPEIRHLLNNLVSMEGCRYLEIGCYQGATFLSAMSNNQPVAHWAIDSFGQFGNMKDRFLKNCDRLGVAPNLVVRDCFSFNPLGGGNISGVNVYFYDGRHSEEEQHRALVHYAPSFAKEFVYVCDDWRGARVCAGTEAAVKELKLTEKFRAIFSSWWEGLGVFVFELT